MTHPFATLYSVTAVVQAAILVHFRREIPMYVTGAIILVVAVALVFLWRKGYIKRWTIGPR